MKNLFLSLTLFLPQIILAQQPNASYPDNVQKLILGDSLSLAYTDSGNGAETLVFIHGLGSYLRAWDKNIATLSDTFRCIAVDLPGYGQSEGINAPYSLDFFAEAVADLIRELGLKNVTLVGHSMGGQIAIHLIAKYPDLIQKLALIAPAGLETFSEQEKAWFKQIYTPAFVASATEAQVRLNYGANFFNMPDDAEIMIADRIQLMSDPGYEAYCDMIPQCVMAMLEEPVTELLPRLKLPVMIIFGANDGLIPNKFLHNTLTTGAVAQKGKELMPHAQLLNIPEAGHFVQWEKSEAVNQALLDFVKN